MSKITKNIIGYASILFITSIFVLIGVMGTISWYNAADKEEKPLGYSESDIEDVIGTSAAPYRFSADAAASRFSTTTGTIYVGNDVNVLDLNINVVEATTTSDVILMVESSNDAGCTTTTADGISGIKWVDASPTDTTLKTATTTYPFSLDAGHGGKYQLTNWNGLCARISLGSASSTVWVSASKQALNN